MHYIYYIRCIGGGGGSDFYWLFLRTRAVRPESNRSSSRLVRLGHRFNFLSSSTEITSVSSYVLFRFAREKYCK